MSLKMHPTSAKCPKCGYQLMTSDVAGYSFVCKECDENFYTIEVKESVNGFYEINIKMTADDFMDKRNFLKSIADKHDCAYFVHDTRYDTTNFGWKGSFPTSDIINSFITDIEDINAYRLISLLNEKLDEYEYYGNEDTSERLYKKSDILKALTDIFADTKQELSVGQAYENTGVIVVPMSMTLESYRKYFGWPKSDSAENKDED